MLDQIAIAPERCNSSTLFFKLTSNPVGVFTLRAATIQWHTAEADGLSFDHHEVGRLEFLETLAF